MSKKTLNSCTSSSESSISGTNLSQKLELCQVCGLPARGNHFGAITCRACAAFFRRASSATTKVKLCKKGNKCQLKNKNGWFECKSCRLQKCYDVGMTTKNFQFDRDPISMKTQEIDIAQSMETFLGRPHCVIFVEPDTVKMEKDVIDCNELLEKAMKIMNLGSETPLRSENSLLKLTMALRKIDEQHSDSVKSVTKYGKNEVLSFFEKDFLKATQWFTYFDGFSKISMENKIKMMEGMWHVWCRLYKLSTAAEGKRKQICDNQHLMISHDSEYAIMDLTEIEFDYSWCSKYSNQQIQHFLDNTQNSFLYKLIDIMVELRPSDVELSFMMCNCSFQYAGQRFQGDILEKTDEFQEKLANELHEYYVSERNLPNYSRRLCQIMKINKKIAEDIRKCREKQQIADTFDVFCVVYSHPAIFKDV